jgi:hypothetical protein
MTRRSARGQSLPADEIQVLNTLEGFELFQRARFLYASGWTLRSIGEAFEPSRARSTVRYWINTPTPIAGFEGYGDLPTTPIPTLATPAQSQRTPRRALTPAETRLIAELAPQARKYRATMNQGHPAAKANRELTDICVRLHHTDRVTIRDLADAAGVSYRAMARRVS